MTEHRTIREIFIHDMTDDEVAEFNRLRGLRFSSQEARRIVVDHREVMARRAARASK